MSDPAVRGGISRREFVGRLITAGAIGAAAGGTAWYFAGREPRGHEGARTLPDHRVAGMEGRMTIAAGSDPARNARAALTGIGGIAAFVRKGEVVLVKPNVGWDRVPDQAANTNPIVVAEIVRMAFEAGAAEVVVADISCNDPARSFARSGIEEAARRAGARVVYSPMECVRADLGGKVLGEWEVAEPLARADRVINVPVVKHHGLALATAGMKNWYGVLGRRRFLLHQAMDEGIVELEQSIRPTLTVLDATRVLMRNGPTGGSLADVRPLGLVAAGTDPVALDAWGAELLGYRADAVGYLVIGEARGLGTRDWKTIAREVRLG